MFYGTYFGIIIGAWEATKFCLKKLLVKSGLGPKMSRTRTAGINRAGDHNDPAGGCSESDDNYLVAVTGGHIYMTRLAGERYHMRRNCGHINGREQKVIEKCLDCARLERYD